MRELEKHVLFLLSMMPVYEERRYTGNTFDSDNLNDITDAIARAGLTQIQREVIEMVYKKDLTQRDVAFCLGLAQTTVGFHLRNAFKAICDAYEMGERE